MKITRRDVKFYLFGIVTMVVIDIIYNWVNFKEGFNEGYNARSQKTEKAE